MIDARRSKRYLSVKAAVPPTVPPAKHPRVKSPQSSKKIDGINVDIVPKIVVSYSWPNQPVSTGFSREVHECVHILLKSAKNSESFTARRGSTLHLMTERGKHLFCRVNQFVKRSKEPSHAMHDCDVCMEGNWLLHRTDVENLVGHAGSPDCQTFLNDLKDHELILTRKLAIMDISRIVGTVRINFLQSNEAIPASLPLGDFFCRYLLEMNSFSEMLEWVKLDTKQIDVPTEKIFDNDDDIGTGEFGETLSSPSNDCESTNSFEETSRITLQEGGGATLRTEIRVGSSYQADIQTFVPGVVVQSRLPVLVYKANAISDNDLCDFLNRVADLHIEYLQNNLISQKEPYTPLSHAKAENFMQATTSFQRLTGSSMSTSSMLAGKRCRLRKECNADAILEVLILHNYDTLAAFDAIKDDVARITSGWTNSEREIFDNCFRRNAGSLRAIARVLAPSKSMKDVIDYFYRFKVSDQFRQFQDKKRSFSVQMVESIESRKHFEAFSSNQTIGLSSVIVETGLLSSHWSNRSISNIAVAADDRLRSAKQLLLDVKLKHGNKRLVEVVSVIKQLQECYEVESRSYLFKLLEDHPDLQKRFLNFLPKHF